MQYKYCKNENFEDFASGSVIIGRRGCSNFPVRLAQEIYCRCLNYLKTCENVSVYDPCCGAGYLLTTLGFLNAHSLKTIICSDYDEEVLKVARQNLGLLTDDGLKDRINHLQNLYAQFSKSAHLQAIASAERLLGLLDRGDPPHDIIAFQADITSKGCLENKPFKADIVLTDIPYGNLVSWQGDSENAIYKLLDNLLCVLKPTSIVAVCSDKEQKISSDQFIRLEKHQVGKRKFEILSPR